MMGKKCPKHVEILLITNKSLFVASSLSHLYLSRHIYSFYQYSIKRQIALSHLISQVHTLVAIWYSDAIYWFKDWVHVILQLTVVLSVRLDIEHPHPPPRPPSGPHDQIWLSSVFEQCRPRHLRTSYPCLQWFELCQVHVFKCVRVVWILYQNSVPTPQKTHAVSIMRINRLMLLVGVIRNCYENHTKRVATFRVFKCCSSWYIL